MALKIVPVKHAQANEFVRRLHRHNKPTLGAILCAGVANESGELCGVAIAGRPVARRLDDGMTLEVLRVCTDGTRNACSMLYSAIRKAATSLGYNSVITYTLPEEGGASLRASGFICEGNAGGSGSMWGTRRGRAMDVIGDDLVGGKLRWRYLNGKKESSHE